MVDFLQSVDSDGGSKEPIPVTIVGGGAEAPVAGPHYESVAASASDQVMGDTGAAGDFLASILVVPATTSPGAITIKDGNGTAITVFEGGADSLSNLSSFPIFIGAVSTAGAWKISTGANVSALVTGRFT